MDHAHHVHFDWRIQSELLGGPGHFIYLDNEDAATLKVLEEQLYAAVPECNEEYQIDYASYPHKVKECLGEDICDKIREICSL